MSIWQILQTEPTADIRAIKRAYAKRTREVHPEDNPEEFSRLYQAYQKALNYAKLTALQRTGNGNPQAESDPFGGGNHEPEMPGDRGSDVFSYFWEEQKRQKEELEVFQEEWDEILKNYGFPPAFQRWEDYVKSENFQEIRWNSQVVELLAEKTEKLTYSQKPKLALWEAYGFKEESRLEYHGDVLRLFENLLPAYEEKKQREQEEHQRILNMKAAER